MERTDFLRDLIVLYGMAVAMRPSISCAPRNSKPRTPTLAARCESSVKECARDRLWPERVTR